MGWLLLLALVLFNILIGTTLPAGFGWWSVAYLLWCAGSGFACGRHIAEAGLI